MAEGAKSGGRRYDQDWLTVLALACVFLFHCGRFIDGDDWHVKSVVATDELRPFMRAATLWLMPTFFLLSGQSAWASLRSRSLWTHLRGRLLRLGLPFAFGALVINSPLQVWIERVGHGAYGGTFWEFYPHYYDGFYAFGGNFAWMGLHLWYLGMLLLFSLLVCPVLVLLPRPGQDAPQAPEQPEPFARGARGLALALGWLPLYAVELAVSVSPHGIGTRIFGGWSPLSYLTIFCLGCLMGRTAWVREEQERLRWALLPAGLATVLALLLVPGMLGSLVLRSAGCWLILMALQGHAARWLNRDTPTLATLREAAMPFYILHQPVIVSTGFLLASWQAPVALVYLVLAASAAGVVVPLTLLAVHSGPFRPLFGLPLAAKAASA